MNEQAIAFPCEGSTLIGIYHPAQDGEARRGVVMIVAAAPQYRVGGHRQAVIWARALAAAGYPVLRFDHRGVGDSDGEFRGYEHMDEDIAAAVDELHRRCPSLQGTVLWGECNAASAAVFYGYRDNRVGGMVLLNPWVRTQAGQAQAVLRHYYWDRLRQPSFWRKVFSLKLNVADSVRSALVLLRTVRRSKKTDGQQLGAPEALDRSAPLPDRMLTGLDRFRGPVMIVMSGRDLIAREFDDLIGESDAWRATLAAMPTTRFDMPDADHTFSSKEQRNQVRDWSLGWLAGT